jgi:maltose-binding protein MalE
MTDLIDCCHGFELARRDEATASLDYGEEREHPRRNNRRGVSMKKIQSVVDHDSTTGRAARLRVQLDFSEDAFDRLEELRKEADAGSKADVIREAIRVYEWLAEQSKAGRMIEVQDEDGHQVSRVEARWFLR